MSGGVIVQYAVVNSQTREVLSVWDSKTEAQEQSLAWAQSIRTIIVKLKGSLPEGTATCKVTPLHS